LVNDKGIMIVSEQISEITEQHIWTVSELNRKIRFLLEEEIGYIWLTGEISNWRVASSKHAYFTLKDSESEISAVMFGGDLQLLKFTPENGIEVIVSGQVTVYERRGTHQIVVRQMEPKGLGALQLAFEQLKKKLELEGLFDPAHKKKLPMLPRKIGIVTSPTGAAIRDILKVLTRRFANIHVILYPARVQGEEASSEIVEGIRFLDRYGVDVIIVGRGGGSLEDLWPFNEERVVRAIYEAQTPIISAVGHEIDFTLADFVADVRAPTPSAAAEMVIQDQTVLWDMIQTKKQKVLHLLSQKIQVFRHRLQLALRHRGFQSVEAMFREYRLQVADYRKQLEDWWNWKRTLLSQRLQKVKYALQIMSPQMRIKTQTERLIFLASQLEQVMSNIVQNKRSLFLPCIAKLEMLSPLNVLNRGYSLTWLEPQHDLVRSSVQLKPGDCVKIQFSKGNVHATVKNIEEDKEWKQ